MKNNMKFRLAEKCLYDYHANLKRLEILLEDLKILRINGDVHAQNYQAAFGSHSEISDPVLKHVEKIQSLENQIKRLQHNTVPITALISDIEKIRHSRKNEEYRQILLMFYFSDYSLSEVADKLHVSIKTIFRRRRSLVFRVIGYLGI